MFPVRFLYSFLFLCYWFAYHQYIELSEYILQSHYLRLLFYRLYQIWHKIHILFCIGLWGCSTQTPFICHNYALQCQWYYHLTAIPSLESHLVEQELPPWDFMCSVLPTSSPDPHNPSLNLWVGPMAMNHRSRV